MTPVVALGATCKCSFGKITTPLIILPKSMVFTDKMMPIGDIMQFAPIVNIPTFGLCQSPVNPAVIAAGGMPVPCVPVIISPWLPIAPTVLLKNIPILTKTSTTFCSFAGVITIANAGQTKVMV